MQDAPLSSSSGVCIGYDTRFGSKSFCHASSLKCFSKAGIPVQLADKSHTYAGAFSYAVRERKAQPVA